MKIIGLTGSIGMGKSVLAHQFQTLGVPVYDADKIVHDIMQPNGAAFLHVAEAFPDVIVAGKIDRKALGKIVFHDADKRRILESIIHPMVRQASANFVAMCRKRRVKICVLDIPLLFETGRDEEMDAVICVTAPRWVQKRRVMARKNMTEDKFKAIVKTQLPDYRKRLRATHIVQTARGRRHTLNTIKRIKNNEQ